jgi:hypothetical protein
MLAFLEGIAKTWLRKVLCIACVVVVEREKKSCKRLREEELLSKMEGEVR